jgi:hypothetical protein
MTNSELINKLMTAQKLLADVYHWSDSPLDGSSGHIKTNAEISRLMSCADSCIEDCLNELEYYE